MSPMLHLAEGASSHSAAIKSQRELTLLDFALELPAHRVGTLMLGEYEQLKAGSKADKERAANDKDGAWFSFAKFKSAKRIAKAVVSVSACVIDLDRGNLSADDIAAKLPGVQHVAYTTYSSSSAAFKWRVIVPYSRPATPEEHARVFAHFETLFSLDGSTRDASRLWFWPACCADTEHDARISNQLSGHPFDIDAPLDASGGGSAVPESDGATDTPIYDDTWFEELAQDAKVAELRALAATWTAEEASERDTWFRNIRICADAADRGVPFKAALDIAEEFSGTTTRKNLASRAEIERKMREPGDKPTIYGAIIVAEQAGYESPARAAQCAAEFDSAGDESEPAASAAPSATPVASGNRIYPIGFRFPDVQSARAALTERFYLIRGKTVEFYDTVLHRTFSPAVLDAEINSTLPSIQTEAGPRKATLKSCLINAPRKTVVDGLAYAPGAGKLVPVGARVFANMFQGFPATTGKMTLSRARPLVYLLWYVRGRRIKRFGVEGTTIGKAPAKGRAAATVTQPVLREPWVRCYINGLAHLWQHPGDKLRFVLAVVGEAEGTGKSLLTNALPSALFGQHNRHVFSRELEGRFTAPLGEHMIFCLEEFQLEREDKQLQRALWQWITEDMLSIERKGQDPIVVPFAGSFFASSNHRDNFAKLGPTSRRFAVEEALPNTQMPVALGKYIGESIFVGTGAMRRDGSSIAALRAWLGAYRIPAAFSPRNPPPLTQVLLDIRESSRGAWESILHEWIDRHPVGIAEVNELRDQLWSSARPGDIPKPNQFSALFKSACREKRIPTPAETPRIGRGNDRPRVAVWGVPDAEAFRLSRTYGSVVAAAGPQYAESAEALEQQLQRLLKHGELAVQRDPLMA